jgi:hypothetical protein
VALEQTFVQRDATFAEFCGSGQLQISELIKMTQKVFVKAVFIQQVVHHGLGIASAMGMAKKVRAIVAEDSQTMGTVSAGPIDIQPSVRQLLHLRLDIAQAELNEVGVNKSIPAEIRDHVPHDKACLVKAYTVIFPQTLPDQITDENVGILVHSRITSDFTIASTPGGINSPPVKSALNYC